MSAEENTAKDELNQTIEALSKGLEQAREYAAVIRCRLAVVTEENAILQEEILAFTTSNNMLMDKIREKRSKRFTGLFGN